MSQEVLGISQEVGGMIGAGLAALLAGLLLVRPRFVAASAVGRILVLGPVFEAVAMTIFAAEHFLAARDLMGIVPRWLGAPLFWTYLVGVALLAAAVSFIAWRYVRWSASLLALLFLIIVVTIDLPVLPKHAHERLFWTLTVRETCFAGGAMVLAGSLWPRRRPARAALLVTGRSIVACTFLFYAVEHFLFPRFVPGVPLEKLTPAWVPAPVLLAWFVGVTLLAAGIGLLLERTRQLAAAAAGSVLLLLTVFLLHPHPHHGDPLSPRGRGRQLRRRHAALRRDRPSWQASARAARHLCRSEPPRPTGQAPGTHTVPRRIAGLPLARSSTRTRYPETAASNPKPRRSVPKVRTGAKLASSLKPHTQARLRSIRKSGPNSSPSKTLTHFAGGRGAVVPATPSTRPTHPHLPRTRPPATINHGQDRRPLRNPRAKPRRQLRPLRPGHGARTRKAAPTTPCASSPRSPSTPPTTSPPTRCPRRPCSSSAAPKTPARLTAGLAACERTGNTHAASEMGAMLEDLA